MLYTRWPARDEVDRSAFHGIDHTYHYTWRLTDCLLWQAMQYTREDMRCTVASSAAAAADSNNAINWRDVSIWSRCVDIISLSVTVQHAN